MWHKIMRVPSALVRHSSDVLHFSLLGFGTYNISRDNDLAAFQLLFSLAHAVTSCGTRAGYEDRHRLEVCVEFFERDSTGLWEESPEEEGVGKAADGEDDVESPTYGSVESESIYQGG